MNMQNIRNEVVDYIRNSGEVVEDITSNICVGFGD